MIEDLQAIAAKILQVGEKFDVVQYAPNKEIHGSLVFFLYPDNTDPSVVKWRRFPARYDRLNEVYRVARGLIENSVDCASLLIPDTFQADNSSYEIQKHVEGISLLRCIRRPLGVNLTEAFSYGRQLCMMMSKLSPTRAEVESSSLWFNEKTGRKISGIPIGLVHNDLGPANILIDGREFHLIDWEGADFAPSVFNLFDYLFHFGSVYVEGRFKRRSNDSYLNAIRAYDSGGLQRIKSDLVASLFELVEDDRPERLVEVLGDFLAYRSGLTGSHLDLLWQDLSAHSDRLQDSLYSLVST